MYKSFKEMKVWQEAMEIAELIFRISEGLPKREDYGLTSQIRRSALSISANIAEAYGRQHSNDKANFYYYSGGSLMETQSHLEYGIRVGYFDLKDTVKIEKLLDNVHFEINKIIKSLHN
jgi:four helix bundle protein